MGAVALPIAVARAGEILLDQRHASEGRVSGIDAGVQDRHVHAGTRPVRGVGADGRDAPRRSRCRRVADLGRLNQSRRHDRRQRPHLRIPRHLPHILLAEFRDIDPRLARPILARRGHGLEWPRRARSTEIAQDRVRWHNPTPLPYRHGPTASTPETADRIQPHRPTHTSYDPVPCGPDGGRMENV